MAQFINDQQMVAMKEIMDELLAVEKGMQPGEVDFVESLSHWKGNFTIYQACELGRMHSRLLARGVI